MTDRRTHRALAAVCLGLMLGFGVAGCAGSTSVPEQADETSSTTPSSLSPDTTADGGLVSDDSEGSDTSVGSESSGDSGNTDGSDGADDTDQTAVVVVAGGLTPEFADTIDSLELTSHSTTIQIGRVQMTASEDSSGQVVDDPPNGFVIQLDARAYTDLDSASTFAPELVAALSQLAPNQVVLSDSSAALRRLDQGSIIVADNGARLEVGLILPEEVVGSSEIILIGPDALLAAGSANPRSVGLVDFEGSGTQLEQVLRTANGGEGVRVFGGRGGDDQQDRDRAVLAQIRVKEIFGEFAFRARGNGAVEIDPAWVDANIVTVDFPLLGRARCHRLYAPILAEVLQGLVTDGQADVIDPEAFQGCWNPRFIGGSDRLSRHAWGIAADINFFNPLDGGPGSPVHPELLDRMAEAGVTSGHNWSSPDPGHFEYLRGLD